MGRGQHAGRVDEQLAQRALGSEVDLRREAAEVVVLDVGPLRAGELLAGLPEQQHPVAGGREARGGARGDVLDHAEHRDDRRRQDRGLAGLVVEADVAAGDRDAELEAGVLEAAAGLGELPHHGRVLGRAEVEAVADRHRRRPARRDVAVGLREGELRAGVRVEAGEPAVAVGGDRDPEVGLVVDADHPAVARLGEHGVALHVAVVLVGDPRLVAQVGARDQTQQRAPAAPRPWSAVTASRRRRPGARPGSRAARTDGGTSGRRAPPSAGVRRRRARRASRSGGGRRR